MKKEEILAASRKENRDQDLAELEIVRVAGSCASAVGGVACCLVLILASFLAQKILYSPWVIYFSMMGTNWLIRGVKKKSKSDWVVAVLLIILAALALVGFIARLLEV